jgi:hypothetical protein
MSPVRRSKARKTIYEILRRFLLILFLACLLFMTSAILLTETSLGYNFEEAISNGWGPYQIALSVFTLGAILMLLAYRLSWLKAFARSVIRASRFTLVDTAAFAVVFWGILWELFWANPPGLVGKWPSISYVFILGTFYWIVALVWAIFRLGFLCVRHFASPPSPHKKRLLQDSPLKSLDEDLLGRGSIVKQIVSLVREFDHTDTLVLAITGEWGTGKTTVINFVLNELENERDLIVVEFDPWYFSVGTKEGIDPILRRFFDILNKTIQSYVFMPNVSRLIKKYYKLLSPIAAKGLIDLSAIPENLNELEQIREYLGRSFQNFDVTVLVIIDDLDRVTGLEIAYILKLLHLCADFDNFIYLLAFDRPFVEGRLGEALGLRKDLVCKRYVDKIVHLELPLPKVEPEVLSSQIFEKCLNLVEQDIAVNLCADKEFSERLDQILSSHIISLLDNPRLIKALFNRYWQMLPLVKGEVNCFDLLILEIIRFRYPQVCETIYCNPGAFISAEDNPLWERTARPESTFKDMTELVGQESQDAVLRLLGSIFPSVRSYHESSSDAMYKYPGIWPGLKGKGIANWYYFPRYFYYAVQQGAFSDVYWDDVVERVNRASTEKIESILEETIAESTTMDKDSQDWVQRMRISIPQFQDRQIPHLIDAITKKAGELERFIAGSVDRSESPRYFHLTYLLRELIQRLQPTETTKAIRSIVQKAADLEFLRQMHDALGGIPDDKDKLREKLKNLATSRIRNDYICDTRNILKKEDHSYGGLLALRSFLEPREYKLYLKRLIESEPRNAILLLSALYLSNGLAYSALKSLIDPQHLLDIAKEVEHRSDQENQLINALRFGIEKEKEGVKLTHIVTRQDGSSDHRNI